MGIISIAVIAMIIRHVAVLGAPPDGTAVTLSLAGSIALFWLLGLKDFFRDISDGPLTQRLVLVGFAVFVLGALIPLFGVSSEGVGMDTAVCFMLALAYGRILFGVCVSLFQRDGTG